MITANQIKWVRSLHQKKNRDESGLFLIEGDKQVQELLASEITVREIYATSDWEGVYDRIQVSPSELERISTVKNPNRVLAVAEIPRKTVVPNKGLTLVLDGVRDPGNMGTLLRSAAWFGVSGILCSEDCVEVYNPKVVRSSMGSLFKIPVVYTSLVDWLKSYSFPRIGLVLGGDSEKAQLHVPDCAIILGNEGEGISPGVQACLDHKLEIGGSGVMESLNVAMAGTVVLYEWFNGISQK